MPRRYPPEFRRKVLDLIAAGSLVAEGARTESCRGSVSECEQDGPLEHHPLTRQDRRSAGQKGCERGESNPHALSGTGS